MELGLTPATRAILANPPKAYGEQDIPAVCHLGVRGIIKKYMPDFCWITFRDLLGMVEQLNPDISEECLKVTLCKMHKEGWVISKPWGHPTKPDGANQGPSPALYMRVR